ncbi:imelysin family protein [Dyadobacter subterraneus]|uniref:Iron-regulated protein n=1 Tax=Dyadobacter subterraneus TaxID=2773304 RepID=A0ABR9WGM4_9BACT|nr:imelysin family protein [Dyadobacter subterraneus]MBE9464653.1 iron-regulated protein [Dyadobacter subterraneus]
MKRFIIPVILLGLMSGCSSSDDDAVDGVDPLRQQVVENYASLVLANYTDAITTAKALQTQVNAFLAAPTAKGLEDCKTAWLKSRIPYLQTEAFRFYDGPIDAAADNYEGLINAWPLDEAYIDYTDSLGTIIYGGVINDLKGYPSITEAVLLGDNEKNGETDVKVGYHAIEFLLWGQDLYADSPGKRPYTDYVTGGTGTNQARRGQYLKIVTDLLVKDLESVKAQWETTGAYRKDFTAAANVDQSLMNIFNGMGKLTKGELSGERMTVLLASKDQEDEHSCFSDNTKNDYIYDEAGIYNVYLGKYTRTDGTVLDGPGLNDLVLAKNASVNTTMIAKLDASVAAINAIPAPVDQSVTKSPDSFKAAITALRTQADQLSVAAQAIGINLTIPESN